MGRVTTPKYRVEYRTNLHAMGKIAADCLSNVDGKSVLMMTWHGKRDGRPTQPNLEQWRKTWNASFQSGGTNAHLAKSTGAIDHINWARIVQQSDGQIMCETRMPTFEVV